VQNHDGIFYEGIARDLLAREGIGVIGTLHLDAVTAYRNGCPRGAEILTETAGAAQRLVQHADETELARYTK
jgi:hypothetical protein